MIKKATPKKIPVKAKAKSKSPKPKSKPKVKKIPVIDQRVIDDSYDIEDRTARIKLAENPIKAEEPKTTSQVLTILSDKRNRLAGQLMIKTANLKKGLREEGPEAIVTAIESLNKEIADLKIAKVKEDARGR